MRAIEITEGDTDAEMRTRYERAERHKNVWHRFIWVDDRWLRQHTDEPIHSRDVLWHVSSSIRRGAVLHSRRSP